MENKEIYLFNDQLYFIKPMIPGHCNKVKVKIDYCKKQKSSLKVKFFLNWHNFLIFQRNFINFCTKYQNIINNIIKKFQPNQIKNKEVI